MAERKKDGATPESPKTRVVREALLKQCFLKILVAEQTTSVSSSVTKCHFRHHQPMQYIYVDVFVWV